MGDLTENFNKAEFACKCGNCNTTDDMDSMFIDTLQTARTIAAIPFKITSGFRCKQHPESIKRPTSSHTNGHAADIAVRNSVERYAIIDGLIDAGFNRIGIGNNFIHVDDDPDKPPFVI